MSEALAKWASRRGRLPTWATQTPVRNSTLSSVTPVHAMPPDWIHSRGVITIIGAMLHRPTDESEQRAAHCTKGGFRALRCVLLAVLRPPHPPAFLLSASFDQSIGGHVDELPQPLDLPAQECDLLLMTGPSSSEREARRLLAQVVVPETFAGVVATSEPFALLVFDVHEHEFRLSARV